MANFSNIMSRGDSASHKLGKVHVVKVAKGTTEEKKARAIDRATAKLGGKIAFQETQRTWKSLSVGNGKEDQEKGNGIIVQLLNQGLSQIEIVNTLGCGGGRVDAMRDRITAGASYVSPKRAPPSHAVNKESLDFFHSIMATWDGRIERGFSCPHMQIKHYFIVKTSWAELHAEYCAAFDALPQDQQKNMTRMKYSTFTQYVHQQRPDLCLSRFKSDVCEDCRKPTDSSPQTSSAI